MRIFSSHDILCGANKKARNTMRIYMVFSPKKEHELFLFYKVYMITESNGRNVIQCTLGQFHTLLVNFAYYRTVQWYSIILK